MKRILLSLGTLVVVGAVVAGATIAYYNDTEVSTGNIFTAGSIDLKVDHTSQTYNGVDCKTCSVSVYSSTATEVVAASPTASFQAVPENAVLVSSPNPAWQNEAALSPAQWIWATDPTAEVDTTNNAEYTFENKFQWNGTAVSVVLDLALASDNGYKIILNGTTIVDNLSTQFNYGMAVSLSGTEATDFKNAMVNGENKLDIVVRNMAYPGGSSGNPAGLLFNLNIQRDPQKCAADSAFQRVCRLWTSKDLGTGDTFFNFGDVKPGDMGTNVISLHVDSNDAYACMLPINKKDLENGCNDAENKVPDPTCGTGLTDGELGSQINVVAWDDGATPDGVHTSGEAILGQGPIKDLLAGKLVVPTGQTKNIGLAWCAGSIPTMTDSSGAVTCNADGMNNLAQTDSFQADLELYAVQTRNNANFTCSSIVPPVTPPNGGQ